MGKVLKQIPSNPTPLWPPTAKRIAPCACSDPWVHHSLSRASEIPKQYQLRLQSQQVRQNASRLAEASGQRQSRLQEDQVHHRVGRAAETPIQHVVRLPGLRKQ
ncbi:hypothetical protein TNCV_1542021 [Trichonephila clavipes]|nr:hypothetical protein TNCV_1542021 [Trichonephila clavipes]